MNISFWVNVVYGNIPAYSKHPKLICGGTCALLYLMTLLIVLVKLVDISQISLTNLLKNINIEVLPSTTLNGILASTMVISSRST